MENRTKVLIVDDETINLDFFDVMLTKLGFKVELAEDGEEALEKVRRFNPDIIILDNIMPKMTGWEVTKLLKNSDDYKDFRNIPIVMFSAMDDVKDKIEGFELGIEDYITKPFNFSEVLARIRSVLHRRALAKTLIQGEKKIAMVTSLNESLVYFTKHLKKPVLDMLKAAQETLSGETEKPKTGLKVNLAEKVEEECQQILLVLKTLEEQIHTLEKGMESHSEEGNGEKMLLDLENTFQQQFRLWKEETKNPGGVGP
ncbi:MAG: response regulator [Spirochaetales bacterium]|nr:MAG: response regulator [Spirochaetales bacterium]